MGLLKEDPVAGNYGFVKCESGLGTVPFDELPDGVVIRALRTLRGQTTEDCRLRLLEGGEPQNCLGRALALFLSMLSSLQERETVATAFSVRALPFGTFPEMGLGTALHGAYASNGVSPRFDRGAAAGPTSARTAPHPQTAWHSRDG